MSGENTEIVRRIYAAWSEGDPRAGADALDQHVVLVVRPEFPEFGVFHGPDGTSKFLRRWLEQWERLSLAAEELRAVGDTVVVRVAQHGKGRVSGIEGDNQYFMLWTFRGRKIVRIEAVMEEDEALAVAGLSE